MEGDISLNNDGMPHSLPARLASFRQSDEARQHLLQQLIQENERLHARHQDLSNDLAAEAASRRHWQNQFKEVTNNLEIIRHQTETSLFALALIDGDGAIFQDQLLRAAADGGSEAGYLLYNEIKKHLQERHGTIGNWTLLVQIYANFEGLSRKLAQVGIIRSPTDLQAFARAFSCSQPLFSFIDVGHGKERADHKIKEMLRLFVSNAQCKHIMFGGAHDNGYLPNLEPYKRDTSITDKITLVTTTSPEPGFLGLGMHITKFPSVFRDTPLPDRYMGDRIPAGFDPSTHIALPSASFPASHANQSPVATPLQQSNQQQPKRSASNSSPTEVNPQASQTILALPQRTKSSSQHESPTSNTGPIPAAASVSSVPKQPGKTTYAGVSDTAASANATRSTVKNGADKPSKPRKAVYLNAYDQRIDMTLPKPETQAINALYQRITKDKVCNNFHLLNSCSAGLNCYFSHEPRLPPNQLAALKWKARERPCGNGSSCREPDCLSGHMCPRGENCESDWCKFSDEAHEVEREVKLKYYDGGEDVEIVR